MTTEFKKGDLVTITKKAGSHENGWNDSWVSTMDRFIGKKCVVDSVGWHGIRVGCVKLNNKKNFPAWVVKAWHDEPQLMD